MAEINSTYTVEKNTTLWSVAKNICKKTDDNVSNADIVKEMKRLAKLNGYDDFNELGDKFKKIGNKIKVDNAVSKETAKKPVQTAHVAQKNVAEQHKKPATHTNPVAHAQQKNKPVVKHSASKFNIVKPHKADSTTVAAADSTYVAPKIHVNNTDSVKKINLKAALEKKKNLSSVVSDINNIKDNKTKIIEWNKRVAKENYVIVDKKNCRATVYSPKGVAIKSYEVGLGQEVGDNFNDGFGVMGKIHRRTAPGQYTVQNTGSGSACDKSNYGKNLFALGTKGNMKGITSSRVAMHQIPTEDLKDRRHRFNDGNLKNNRMSYGCINFVKEQFEDMKKYLGNGLGTNVYILPEEAGNELKLGRNAKG